jgi:hypothetical protein
MISLVLSGIVYKQYIFYIYECFVADIKDDADDVEKSKSKTVNEKIPPVIQLPDDDNQQQGNNKNDKKFFIVTGVDDSNRPESPVDVGMIPPPWKSNNTVSIVIICYYIIF